VGEEKLSIDKIEFDNTFAYHRVLLKNNRDYYIPDSDFKFTTNILEEFRLVIFGKLLDNNDLIVGVNKEGKSITPIIRILNRPFRDFRFYDCCLTTYNSGEYLTKALLEATYVFVKCYPLLNDYKNQRSV